MSKCLWEVAQCLAAGTGLFRVQAEMIGIAEHLLEEKPRVFEPGRVGAAGPRESLHQPERAHVECPFPARKPVGRGRGIVAVHEPVGGQSPLVERTPDRIDCAEHPRIVRSHEEDEGHQQARCVERIGTERLDKRLAIRVPSFVHDLFVDLVADSQPARAVGRKRTLVGEPQAAIECDPAHIF